MKKIKPILLTYIPTLHKHSHLLIEIHTEIGTSVWGDYKTSLSRNVLRKQNRQKLIQRVTLNTCFVRTRLYAVMNEL